MGFLEFVPPRKFECKWLTSPVLDWHLLQCDISSFELIEEILEALLEEDVAKLLEPKVLDAQLVEAFKPFLPLGKDDWSEGMVLCKQCALTLMKDHILDYMYKSDAQGEYSRLLLLWNIWK